MSGPIINPIKPRKKTPPTIPRRITPEWTFVFVETKIGFAMFSKSEPAIPKSETPIIGSMPPLKNK